MANNKKFLNKNILFLGGSIFFMEAAEYVKNEGGNLIVVDINGPQKAVVKQICDVALDFSTTDVSKIVEAAKKYNIDGIYAGASEVNIPVAIEACKQLNIPYYCNTEQWAIGTNKRLFKELCEKFDVPITPYYDVNFIGELKELESKLPLVTKPVDNNGSTGISICRTLDELIEGYKEAIENSKNGDLLIEDYIPSEAVIIHYTICNGEIHFSGMSDKKSFIIKNDGAPVMGFQSFQSDKVEQYIAELDQKVKKMYKSLNMSCGVIWIEAFYNNSKFIFNEMAFRFGGSMTYIPVNYYYGVNQMELILDYSINGFNEDLRELKLLKNSKYCIIPIHMHSGLISAIKGVKQAKELDYVVDIVQCHVENTNIAATGTVSQVFCYLHMTYENESDIKTQLINILNIMKVYDVNNNSMLYTLLLQ